MKKQIDDLVAQANAAYDKYKDPELRDQILGAVQTLEVSDAMYHQFGRLLRYTRATVAHQSRSSHLREAIDGAQQALKRYESASHSGAQ
jgi:hypothetical protein